MSDIRTIRIDNFINGGFNTYDAIISDHLPVGLKLYMSHISSFKSNSIDQKKKIIDIRDVLGKRTNLKYNIPLFYIFSDGTAQKVLIPLTPLLVAYTDLMSEVPYSVTAMATLPF